MNDNDKLPLELVWEVNGEPVSEGFEGAHLSEIVRTAIADGQMSIVPNVAFTHLQSCETCVCAIGEAAMLSTRISSHFNEVAHQLAPAVANQAAAVQAVRLPWFAIAAALMVAGIAALPTLAGAQVWFAESSRVAARAIPHLIHGAVAALHGRGVGISLAVSYASAALLMLGGITIAMRQNQANAMRSSR